MRQGPNARRPRGRPNRKPHGGSPRGSYDSNGPEGRVRGNAHQVYEKYVGLARDALSAGDRVQAETFFQHAEHYFRILNASTDPQSGGSGGRRSWNGHAEGGPFSQPSRAQPDLDEPQPDIAPTPIPSDRAQPPAQAQAEASAEAAPAKGPDGGSGESSSESGGRSRPSRRRNASRSANGQAKGGGSSGEEPAGA